MRSEVPVKKSSGTEKFLMEQDDLQDVPVKNNPVVNWDITIPWNAELPHTKLIDLFKDLCKEWCFQLEVGVRGDYKHYQCRVNLRKKARLTELVGLLGLGPGIHLSRTAKVNYGNHDYVSKGHTRVEGPWKHTDPAQREMPWDIAMIKELRPYQQSIVDMVKDHASGVARQQRQVNVLIDLRGNIGKTALRRYMSWHGLAHWLPYCNDFDKLMQMAASMMTNYGKRDCYIVDLPRSVGIDQNKKLGSLYAGIEVLKDGDAFDPRYATNLVQFGPPVVIVTTNSLPDQRLLSNDRWKLWTVNEKLELVPFEICGPYHTNDLVCSKTTIRVPRLKRI